VLTKRSLLLLSLLLVGVGLLLLSIDTSFFVAAPWFSERAHDEWHMNNYFIVPGFYAFIFFAFLSWFFGGLFMAASIPAFLRISAQKRKLLFIPFLLAILLSGLGFNTFDFMLGCFYWTNGCEPAPVLVDLLVYSFHVNAWNYYFFLYLIPLYVSGICFGLALAYAWLKPKL